MYEKLDTSSIQIKMTAYPLQELIEADFARTVIVLSYTNMRDTCSKKFNREKSSPARKRGAQ
jgi:hypothetical protein